MVRVLWLVAVLAAFSTVSAVAQEAAAPAGKVAVAVAAVREGQVTHEFEGKAGVVCANALSQELMRLGYFEVAERHRISQVMEELKLQQSGMVAPEQAAQIGKMLAVKYLIYGDVERVEVKRGIANMATEAALGAVVGGIFGGGRRQVKSTDFVVVVTYKVTDVESGRVMLQRTFEDKESATQHVEESDARVEYLSRALRKTAVQMARSLMPKVQGIVADTDTGAGTFLINRGAQHGIGTGMLLRVFRKGKEIKDPETGAVIKVEKNDICLARCTEVTPLSSTFETGEMGKKGFQVNKMRVRDVKVGDTVETCQE